jgi:hypothetical protein
MYIIRNKINGLFWSNNWDWGSRRGATGFRHTEYNLPIDGKWIKIK